MYLNYNTDREKCQDTSINRVIIKQYKNDVVVSLLDSKITASNVSGAVKTRSEIVEWSRESRKRYRLMLQNCIDEMSTWIVLTYPDNHPWSGRKSKKHLNSLLQWLRRENIRYLWGMEFQTRGAIHYNILVTGWVNKKELAEHWFNIVGSGDLNHLGRGTSVRAINKKNKKKLVGYLCGYLRKVEQTIVPEMMKEVGRFWGASRGILKVIGEYYLRSKSYNESRKIIRILRKYNEAKIRSWQMTRNEERKERGLQPLKLFKWKLRKFGGFTMWNCSDGLKQILEQSLMILKTNEVKS